MDYRQVDYELKHSPAIRLLRSRNAALVVSFLHSQFKSQRQSVSIAQLALEEKLASYLEYFQEDDFKEEGRSSPGGALRMPKEYLKRLVR